MPRISRSDRFFILVVSLLIGAIVGSWYCFSPNSPRFKKVSYFLLFEEVGTLQPSNLVRINGLKGGEVRATRLTGDGVVEVEIAVFETIPLPKDTRFRVVNTGLVGERIVDVALGKSEHFLRPGDRVSGGYDAGTTRLVVNARSAVQEADILLQTLHAAYDSLFGERQRERFSQLYNNLFKQMKRIENLGLWSADTLQHSLELLQNGVKQWVDLLENQSQNRHQMEQNWEETKGSVAELRLKIDSLEVGVERVSRSLSETSDGSLAQMLHRPEFHQLVEEARGKAELVLKAFTK